MGVTHRRAALTLTLTLTLTLALTVPILAVLAACSPSEAPDRPVRPLLPPRDQADTLATLPGIPVVVAPTAMAAAGSGPLYAQAIADALAERLVFASTRNPASQSYLLQTALNDHELNARLIRPDGLTIGHWQVAAPTGPAPDAHRLASQLADEMTGHTPAASTAETPAAATPTPPKPSFVIGAITGAPGDGAKALSTALTRILATGGFTVLPAARDDSLIITLIISRGPPINGAERVKLTWSVSTADGRTLGSVAQENDVPAGSLNSHWGPIASAAALGGAQGVVSIAAQAATATP